MDWIAATKDYNQSNCGHTTYMDLPIRYAASNRRESSTTPSKFIASVLVYENLRIRCNTKRMKLLTSNLLHELVHAIVEAYACACQDCEKNILEGEGKRGHGPVWMAISRKVEETILRVPRYRCWLGRSQSLAHEHHDVGTVIRRENWKRMRSMKDYIAKHVSIWGGEHTSNIAFSGDDFVYQGGGKLDITNIERDHSEDEDSID
ncbi:uncharacterized protein RAG0_14391 [Rhynchosporium agropyri]|uniref:SprT-like domain-containing protein n=1 Tax=Rhynchosporium agropyri TaxID=914238 RepID=A0A1E1LGW8_9HELO|nr:uncharacterized protein RAG0_14391 [Rhynchosporium agropyri]